MRTKILLGAVMIICFFAVAFAIVFTGVPLHSTQEIDLTASARITAAGGFVLNSDVPQAGSNLINSMPQFGHIRPFIDGDLNITSLVGVIPPLVENLNASSSPAELLRAMRGARFNLVITANNRAFDRGWQGMLQIQEVLNTAWMNFTGTFTSREDHTTPHIVTLNGIQVGITAWAALGDDELNITEEQAAFAMNTFDQTSIEDVPRMLEDVQRLRRAGAEVVIMVLHWGYELQETPTPRQMQIARRLAAGGVDVILGNNHSTVQTIEILEGVDYRNITVYSMGSFFTDLAPGETPAPTTRYGMLVYLDIERGPDGNIRVDVVYMPTLHFRVPNLGFVVLPAGRYAEMTQRPNYITPPTWQNLRSAWEHVRRVVGPEIPVFSGA